jgi:4-hydroxy-tetrahydrodipicolinate reductase
MSQSLKIGILGGKGRLGSMIMEELEELKIPCDVITRDMDMSKKYDCIIDVSSPDGTKELLIKLITMNQRIPLIVGTTGKLPEDLISTYAEIAPVIMSTNFTQGVQSINMFLDSLSPGYWQRAEITDMHHISKKDSPSGTAKSFKDILDSKEIPCTIDSIRMGAEVGYHKIVLCAASETITITHDAHDRSVFAKGCVDYVMQILRKDKGVWA